MRILVHMSVLISFFFLPWWVTALFLFTACVILPRFYESIVYGIMFDVLYASPFGFHGFALWGSVFALIAFCFGSFIRERLSW